MDRAAQAVMEALPDVVIGFGESDEYSFLLRKSCTLYNRRQRYVITRCDFSFQVDTQIIRVALLRSSKIVTSTPARKKSAIFVNGTKYPMCAGHFHTSIN